MVDAHREASSQREWARVRHVTVGSDRSQGWSLRPWLSAVLLVPAVVMLLRVQQGSESTVLAQGASAATHRAALASRMSGAKLAAPSDHAKAAKATGFVQALRAHSKADVGLVPAQAQTAAQGKPTARKTSSGIMAAAKRTVATNMLQEAAAPAEPAAKGADQKPEKILLKMYMESECPACRKFSTTYLKEILNAQGMGDIVDFKIVPWGWGVIESAPTEKQLELNPKADYSDNVLNETSKLMPILTAIQNRNARVPSLMFQCQHGFRECEGNAYESCLQAVAPRYEDFFPVFDCVEARSCAENIKPPDCVDSPGNVMQGCLSEFGKRINTPELLSCYHGDRMRELLVMNNIATIEAKPQWVPWFTLDGVDLVKDPDNKNATVSFREQFLLGKAICDLYVKKTGEDAPPGCKTFPQDDEAVGVDPWARFPKLNFTEFIEKQNREVQLKAAAQQALIEEQMSPWRFFKIKMLLVVFMLFLVGFAASWCVSKSMAEAALEKQEKEGKQEKEAGKEEHV